MTRLSQTTASIIADTINAYGARITTFQVTAPRFILAEINTHRVIARSAASSRAIPLEKRIQATREAPFIPQTFGKNRRGMQATEDLVDDAAEQAESIWVQAAEDAIRHAVHLGKLEVHKQTANRLLEPFVYYTGVMTSTEWDNFFKLRTDPDAQPEFRELALLMQELYTTSTANLATYHLPYTDDLPDYTCRGWDQDTRFAVSAARCARVSYFTHDGGAKSTVEADRALCEKLIKSGHLSPFDHPAKSDTAERVFPGDVTPYFKWDNPAKHRHNWGWIPRRVAVEEATGLVCRRDSYAAFY